MKKIFGSALAALLFALSYSALAQQAKIPRLGFLRAVAGEVETSRDCRPIAEIWVGKPSSA
jgi:hypothetical protein